MSLVQVLAFLTGAVSVLVYYLWSSNPAIQSVRTVDKVDESYDYIVVGGGSAGCVVASRLSEDKHVKVLLLEAGGDYTENPSYHIPFEQPTLLKSKADWGYYTVSQTYSSKGLNVNRGYLPRGRVLGGTSMINYMMYTRGSRQDFDEWAAGGCDGWGYHDVLLYFIKSEDIRIDELIDSRYHGICGNLAVSSGKLGTTSLWMEAGQELGYDIIDYNGETMEGFSPIQLTVRNGIRSSTSVEFLAKKVNDRKNIHISLDSFATKLEIENGRVMGVYYIKNNRKHYVKANKEVIVSAGAINSPQLLMLSGIGPKKHLEEMDIPVIADLPVGKNLQDHLFVHLLSSTSSQIGFKPSDIDDWRTKMSYTLFGTGLLSVSGADVVAFLCSEKEDSSACNPDIQLYFLGAYFNVNLFNNRDEIADVYLGKPSSVGFDTVISINDLKSVGNIKLKSKDPFDYPLLDPKYLSDPKDVAKFLKAYEYGRSWSQLQPCKTLDLQSMT